MMQQVTDYNVSAEGMDKGTFVSLKKRCRTLASAYTESCLHTVKSDMDCID